MQSIQKYEFYKHTSIAPHIRLQRTNECNNRTKKITLRMSLNMRSVSTNGWDYYKWTRDDIIPWCEQEPTDYILCVIQGRNSDSQYSFLASYFFTAASAATLLSLPLLHTLWHQFFAHSHLFDYSMRFRCGVVYFPHRMLFIMTGI